MEKKQEVNFLFLVWMNKCRFLSLGRRFILKKRGKKRVVCKFSGVAVWGLFGSSCGCFCSDQPSPPAAAHVRRPAPRLVREVELQRRPLLVQLVCLCFGRDGFIGYLREHSLFPLHSQQPAQRQACIIDEFLAAATLSQRSCYLPSRCTDIVHVCLKLAKKKKHGAEAWDQSDSKQWV